MNKILIADGLSPKIIDKLNETLVLASIEKKTSAWKNSHMISSKYKP